VKSWLCHRIPTRRGATATHQTLNQRGLHSNLQRSTGSPPHTLPSPLALRGGFIPTGPPPVLPSPLQEERFYTEWPPPLLTPSPLRWERFHTNWPHCSRCPRPSPLRGERVAEGRVRGAWNQEFIANHNCEAKPALASGARPLDFDKTLERTDFTIVLAFRTPRRRRCAT
jgi:hypothetical protein